jgi:predicted Zn-dependent protease/predicted small secreted protein
MMKRSRLWPLAGGALAAVLLLTGCETMPGKGGDGLTSALGSVLGGGGSSSSGLSSGLKDVIGGATAAFKDYSEEEQRALGVEFSSVLLGARPLLRNANVQRYVNQVGWWVAMQAEPPVDKDGRPMQFAWRFGVIDSDAVNAYATPGGYVFITVGLLRKLNNEAELAGVLGHEIAHVVRGHYLSALKKGGFTQMAGGIVKARTNNSAISSAMVNAVRNLYAKGLDQSDEFDADREGMLYAARAGYRAAGLPTVLQMYAANGSGSDANYQMLFNTHPAPVERAGKLQPLLASKFASAADVTNETRFLVVRRQVMR